jgi:predicted enzyme related to lactoylglutathione lyase
MHRARAFYERVLQVKLDELPSPAVKMLAFPAQPDRPGCGGALVRYEGKESGAGGTLVYFSCADCAVEAARAVESGGRVFKPKFPIGQYGFISLIFDTEGNMVGLHSLK